MKFSKQLVLIVLLSAIALSAFPQAYTTIRLYCRSSKNTKSPLLILVFKNKSYVLDSNKIAMLNPDYIEKIEVLKDAAATALYGRRAVDGVIIVVVKKKEARKEYNRLKPYLSKL